MSFSVSPSVTVREVDLTTSIPSITTPPAAVAGVFRWGPVNERVLISSEVELANVFGTPTDFNAETFFTAADFLSYSNALYVVRVEENANTAIGENGASETVFEGKYPGSIANDFEIAYVVTGSDGDTSQFSTEVLQNDAFTIEFNSNTLEIVSSDDVGDIDIRVGDSLLIGTDETGYQALEVTAFTNISSESANNGIEYTHEITFRQRFVGPVDPTRVFRNWKGAGVVDGAPATDSIAIVVIDRVGSISGTPNTILERFENLSLIPGTKSPEGDNRFYRDVIEERSAFIKPGPDSIANTSAREYFNLTGGTDGLDESAISFGKVALGYELFKEANDVDVSFILQGRARGNDVDQASLANYLISNIAETRRDCIVFVSPRRSAVVNVSTEQEKLNNVLSFRAALAQNSSYAFIDSGYKYRYDKYNDVFRFVPLNGDMAGLASLVEPWESPAGFRKGRVRNVIKLAFNPNKAQRDQLYGRDINPVITQVGQGTILFGDKTALGTATGSAFTRINVRRLFITVEKAIATIASNFLFEFNDEFTQNQFRQIVDPLLRDIQGRRGIIDFRVISDATVNTPQVVDSNTFRANIFIKPSRAINQIELTFVATRTGVEFEEIVGQQF